MVLRLIGTAKGSHMELGIFASTFSRPTLETTLDAVVEHGLSCMQFDLVCAGLETLPDRVDPALARKIRQAVEARGLQMAAISGTFNMIDPDLERRQEGLRRLDVLAAACATLGTRTITLCTGTRDPNSMWRRHPDNDTPAAWDDLVASMQIAVESAARHDVILAFEPEVANVIDSALKARSLLDTFSSPHLKVVIDGANIFHTGELPRMREILDEAFALLGSDIVAGHAKDLDHDGAAGHLAAGHGLLDYPHYIALLRGLNIDGPLFLHGLTEEQVDGCVAFVQGLLDA